jgi:hypothetical protein
MKFKAESASAVFLIVIGLGLLAPSAAEADSYCSSFSLYSYCAEVPGYTTPPAQAIERQPDQLLIAGGLLLTISVALSIRRYSKKAEKQTP